MELAIIVLIWTVAVSVAIVALASVVLLSTKADLNNARRDSIMAETAERKGGLR